MTWCHLFLPVNLLLLFPFVLTRIWRRGSQLFLAHALLYSPHRNRPPILNMASSLEGWNDLVGRHHEGLELGCCGLLDRQFVCSAALRWRSWIWHCGLEMLCPVFEILAVTVFGVQRVLKENNRYAHLRTIYSGTRRRWRGISRCLARHRIN